jgi:general secretion pathway protein D
MVPLLSCTTWKSYEKARQAEQAKEWDEAVMQYNKALELDPENIKLKMAVARARLEASRVHFEKGKTYEAAALTAKSASEQFRLAQLAATELELTTKLDTTNQWAAVELGKTVALLQDLTRSEDAKSIEAAKRRAKAASGKVAPPQLNPASDQPISLSFPHETPVKEIYRALGNAFGINIMFDQAVKDDRISIELKDVTAQQALERVMQAANHFYKVLDEHTIIVVPDNPQARRDYEDLVIQTFYLSNGDAEQVTNVVRTMIEARNVFPLKALNAITIRDTADKVKIAQKIIEANDKAKAEVVVDVELLQLDINKTRNLGMDLTGTSGSLQAVGPPDDKGVRNPLSAVTRQQLAHLGAGDLMFNIPSIEYAFLKSATNSELLANPELRISEGEKATLHIGSRIPVPVSTFTSVATTTSGGTFAPVTSFQYQDIGIKVSMEPRVHHNREVTLKLTVEVSSLGGSAPGTGTGGVPSQPIFNTRTIESTIRLKDGETNFLAGLIQDSKTDTANQTPFLGEIPILGRLFTTDQKQQVRTDLVLTMTPHIVRIADITDDDLSPMWVGTQNNITFRGVSPRLESQVVTDPFTARPDLTSTIGGGGRGNNPNGNVPIENAPPPGVMTPAPGTLPNSPFQGRPAPVNPNPNPVEPQAQVVDPINKPVATVAGIQISQGTAPTDAFAPKPAETSSTPLKAASAAATSDTTNFSLSPRLSPQPVNVSIRPGLERNWSVVAMDLDGLTASQIVMHYDPKAMDVLDLAFGPAIVVDATTPPVVSINRDDGTIRISSSDKRPLQFNGGGDLVTLHVRGGVTGETFLVLDNPDFRNAEGKMVMSTISGGRVRVE